MTFLLNLIAFLVGFSWGITIVFANLGRGERFDDRMANGSAMIGFILLAIYIALAV